MGKKTLMMIVFGVAAVGLLVVKIGPLVMPRSWRMKRARAKRMKAAGLSRAEIAKKEAKRKAGKQAKKPASKSSGKASPVHVAGGTPPKPASKIDISAIDRKIAETGEITEMDLPGEREVKCPFMKCIVEEKEEKEKPSLHVSVSGILYDTEKPLAIINGEIYKVGEKVGNTMVVEEIREDFVVLSEGKKKIKVFVGE